MRRSERDIEEQISLRVERAELSGNVQGAVWPGKLRELRVRSKIRRLFAGVVRPASLQELSFGNDVNQPIIGAVWLASLQQPSVPAATRKTAQRHAR